MSIIVGLDIGSTKVAEIVARVGRDGDVEVVGAGAAPCKGIRRGVVADVESVAGAIREAHRQACRAAGTGVRTAYVSIPCANTMSVMSRGVTAVADPDGTITAADVRRALGAARVLATPPDREIVCVLPTEYTIDGVGGVKNPEGMTGVRLEVDAKIVMVQAPALESVATSVENAGLSVAGWILDPLASARTVLDPEEMDRGVLLVDVGGQMTQIALFCEGAPAQLACVPAGGVHVTNDIAVGMRISLEEAEGLKTAGRFDDELLRTIVEARAREILELVDSETRAARHKGLAPCGVVFVGGGSLLSGFVELARDVLDLPARAGGISASAAMAVRGRDRAVPSLTALGIVEYVAHDSVLGLGNQARQSALREALSAVRGWFADFVKDFF